MMLLLHRPHQSVVQLVFSVLVVLSMCYLPGVSASNTWNNCSLVTFRYHGLKIAEKNVCVSLDYRDCKTIYITGQADGYDDRFSEQFSVTELLQNTTYQRSYRTEVVAFTCDVLISISDFYGSKPNFGGCADYLVMCNNSTVSLGRFSCFQLDDVKCIPPLERITVPPARSDLPAQRLTIWSKVYWVVGAVAMFVFVVLVVQVIQCVRNRTSGHRHSAEEEEELAELSKDTDQHPQNSDAATDKTPANEEGRFV